MNLPMFLMYIGPIPTLSNTMSGVTRSLGSWPNTWGWDLAALRLQVIHPCVSVCMTTVPAAIWNWQPSEAVRRVGTACNKCRCSDRMMISFMLSTQNNRMLSCKWQISNCVPEALMWISLERHSRQDSHSHWLDSNNQEECVEQTWFLDIYFE